MNSKQMTGADALLSAMLEEGVDTVFGYPGGGIMPLYDRLYDYRDVINHILVRHEQGGVHAAEGYARASGKVGVCFATAGPGATNLITGLADAMLDSTPIVCVAAQVVKGVLGTNAFQEADTISITNPITKWSYEITEADEVAEVIARAFYIARSGRPGPVMISITKNAQIGMTKFDYKPHPVNLKTDKFCGNYCSDDISKAVELLNEAQRPMVIVGQGVALAGAEKGLLEFAEKSQIPVVSTLLGISSLPTHHPLFKGNVGMHGNYAPNMMTQKSDLILALGMRFSDRVTGDPKRYAPNAKIIHVEIDRAELNKVVKADVAINGNVKEVLPLLTQGVRPLEREEWFEEIESMREKEMCELCRPLLTKSDCLNMAMVVDAVAEKSDGNAVIVTDVGQHQMYSAQYSKFRAGRSLITSGGLGTMGFGIPAAMGAKIAVPDKEVVLFVGDGGFQMSLQELGTIMQSRIGVKIVLLNNNFLGMVRQWQQLFFDTRYSFTEMDNPDFVKIVEAYGIKSKRVTALEQLDQAVDEMLSYEGAYFLEAVVEAEDNVYPMVPAGAALEEMLMS